MNKFYNRSDSKECIDNPHVACERLKETYQQVKSINRYTMGYWPTMSAIAYFLSRYGRNCKIKILDIGCGDGETLRLLDEYAHTHHFSLELIGIDLNRDVISSAIEQSSSRIKFIHADILTIEADETYDLIINSLTMHHLSNQEIVKLMQWMSEHARIGWFISDLHRSAIAYYFIKYFVKLCRFNYLVCHDAPLSVARSFRRGEWVDLLIEAKLDLERIKLSWYPNFRYGIRYDRGEF